MKILLEFLSTALILTYGIDTGLCTTEIIPHETRPGYGPVSEFIAVDHVAFGPITDILQTYNYQGAVHPREIENWNEIGRQTPYPWCEIFYENPNPSSSIRKPSLIVDVPSGSIEAYTYLDEKDEPCYLHFSIENRSYTFREMTERQRQAWLESYQKMWRKKGIEGDKFRKTI